MPILAGSLAQHNDRGLNRNITEVAVQDESRRRRRDRDSGTYGLYEVDVNPAGGILQAEEYLDKRALDLFVELQAEVWNRVEKLRATQEEERVKSGKIADMYPISFAVPPSYKFVHRIPPSRDDHVFMMDCSTLRRRLTEHASLNGRIGPSK